MELLDKVIELQKLMIECGHTQHLTREKSLRAFCDKYADLKAEADADKIFHFVFQTLKLMMSANEWELRYGGIQIAVKTLELSELSNESGVLAEAKSYLFEKCRSLVSDEEFRVRNCIGDIMQKLIEYDGSKVYAGFKDFLFANIRDTFSRDPKGSDASSGIGKFRVELGGNQNCPSRSW